LVTTFLTKSGGLLGPIAHVLGLIMNGIYEFFNIFGIQNIALCIIVFTFLTKALMLPLTIKQQKFTKLSSRMNPELQKIQAKYKGKRDQDSITRQQAETQAVYHKYGASPTAGCLPLIITLPIMFALYQVINNIPAYVDAIKSVYDNIAIAIQNTGGDVATPMKVLADNAKISIVKFNEMDTNVISNNHIIDILSKFKSTHWDQLSDSFPAIKDVIVVNASKIKHANSFFGVLNIADAPGWKFPGLLIPFLAMALQFVQGKQIAVKNTTNKDNPTANAMSSMNTIMPIMSGVFCIMLPIGVGIYWIASSLFAIAQQYFVNKYMDHINVEELIEKSAMKASKRREKMGTVPNNSMQELAKKQTKSIEGTVTEKIDSPEKNEEEKKKVYEPTNFKKSNVSYKSGSIAANANLLQKRNSEKGDK